MSLPKTAWRVCVDCSEPIEQSEGKGRPRLRCPPCVEADRLASKRRGGVERWCLACGSPAVPRCSYCELHRPALRVEREPVARACRTCSSIFHTVRDDKIYCDSWCRRFLRSGIVRVEGFVRMAGDYSGRFLEGPLYPTRLVQFPETTTPICPECEMALHRDPLGELWCLDCKLKVTPLAEEIAA